LRGERVRAAVSRILAGPRGTQCFFCVLHLREWTGDDSLLPIPLDVLVRKTSRIWKMKKRKAAKTVDEYLAGVPEPAQSTLKHIRAVIQSVVPKETTEVISYGMPMFKYNGMLVGYAAFKKHCSLFPTGSGVLDQFEKELKGFRTSKGTIQFPPDKPLADALVKKIVKARVRENEEWD
jgi:uncharacterized protein YdhG (YjbR/CyaY superfamily)